MKISNLIGPFVATLITVFAEGYLMYGKIIMTSTWNNLDTFISCIGFLIILACCGLMGWEITKSENSN